MSKTYLHKEKGKSKHGVYGEEFKDYPFKVKKYYDRHCGSNDDKVNKLKQMGKENKDIIIDNEDYNEVITLTKALHNPDGECQAYKDAKAINSAYIIEDGWLVRVYADDHREKIKYIGETNIKINKVNKELDEE